MWPKMSGALRHVLITRCAFVLPINGAKLRVVQSKFTRSLFLFIHGLRIFDMSHAHVLDLFRRKQTELDLLNRAQGRTRVGKDEVRHLGLMEGVTLRAISRCR